MNERTHCIALLLLPPYRRGRDWGASVVASSHPLGGGLAYEQRVKPGKGRDVVELGRPVNGARVVI